MMQLVQIAPGSRRAPRPDWLKVRIPGGDNYYELKRLMRGLGLHTVCESARCPNIGECWGHRTATFMILGERCTRRCGFCAVPKGRPGAVDWEDLEDGGASVFAMTVRELRQRIPGVQTELLIPDFRGSDDALAVVLG